jgi:hypothetical protein
MATTEFGLSKWYLDCVADDGEAVVVYVAELRWRALSIGYSSVLGWRAGETRVRTSARTSGPPSVHDDSVVCSSESLGFHGTWRSQSTRLTRTILDSDHGRLEWDCLQPRASVSLHVDGRTIEGLGYVEHVRMSVPPWRMPFDTLHWGRFLEASARGVAAAIVWIDLRGSCPARYVFVNGVEQEVRDLSDSEIALANGDVLRLDRRDVLREGALGQTVLSAIPRLARAVPGRILGLHETKWRSRGALGRADGRTSTGWAIHEVVRWP